MSKIKDFFESQKPGDTELNQEQLLAMIAITPAEELKSEEVDSEIAKEWSKRGHENRNKIKALLKDRNFKYLLKIHDEISGDIKMNLTYAMWITALSKRNTDVLLHHAISCYKAKTLNENFLTLELWATEICPNGIWKPRDWKQMWQNQKQDKENILDKKELWDEFYIS